MQETVEHDTKQDELLQQEQTKPIVIGISGATRSGKGTLSKKLQAELGGEEQCIKLCQDRFFDVEKIYKELGNNWEVPEALDHDAFFATITEEIERPQNENIRYIILEGFLLFHDKRIVELMDYRFWLEISKKVCYDRRMSTKRVREQYFASKLWPGYQRYRKSVFKDKQLRQTLIQIDGTWNSQRIVQTALKQMGIEYVSQEEKDEAFDRVSSDNESTAAKQPPNGTKCKCIIL